MQGIQYQASGLDVGDAIWLLPPYMGREGADPPSHREYNHCWAMQYTQACQQSTQLLLNFTLILTVLVGLPLF